MRVKHVQLLPHPYHLPSVHCLYTPPPTLFTTLCIMAPLHLPVLPLSCPLTPLPPSYPFWPSCCLSWLPFSTWLPSTWPPSILSSLYPVLPLPCPPSPLASLLPLLNILLSLQASLFYLLSSLYPVLPLPCPPSILSSLYPVLPLSCPSSTLSSSLAHISS
jgi:hypothetical protein